MSKKKKTLLECPEPVEKKSFGQGWDINPFCIYGGYKPFSVNYLKHIIKIITGMISESQKNASA